MFMCLCICVCVWDVGALWVDKLVWHCVICRNCYLYMVNGSSFNFPSIFFLTKLYMLSHIHLRSFLQPPKNIFMIRLFIIIMMVYSNILSADLMLSYCYLWNLYRNMYIKHIALLWFSNIKSHIFYDSWFVKRIFYSVFVNFFLLLL